jgi:hypothetical protein
MPSLRARSRSLARRPTSGPSRTGCRVRARCPPRSR